MSPAVETARKRKAKIERRFFITNLITIKTCFVGPTKPPKPLADIILPFTDRKGNIRAIRSLDAQSSDQTMDLQLPASSVAPLRCHISRSLDNRAPRPQFAQLTDTTE